jgi:hypothetical protein
MRAWPSDKYQMQIKELLSESNVLSLAKKAYEILSPDAKHAIDKWESHDWIGGDLENHIRANDSIAHEIEAAFKPVRDSIPGDFILLYRGYIPDAHATGWRNRYLESWSLDKRVAEYFGGLRKDQTSNERNLYHVPTPADIETAIKTYEKSGFVKFMNHYYVRNKENSDYYNIFDKNRQFVTDGDNLRRDLTRDVQHRTDRNRDRLESSIVLSEKIDKNRIVWITNRLNSKEFIVRVK